MATPTFERFSKPATAELGKGTSVKRAGFHLSADGIAPDWATGASYPAFPAIIQLGFLRDGRLRVREAIEVTVFEEEGDIVAAATGLNEFGFGDNPTEAIADLQQAIADLYLTLEAEQDHLGKGLRRVWEILNVKVERR